MTGHVFYRYDFKGAFPGHIDSEFTGYFLILICRHYENVGQTLPFNRRFWLLFVVVCRYFTLFMNLLNDCSEVEDEGQAVGGRKRGMSRRLASLRHCTVLAMSNLLNANVDSGLMHSIGKPATTEKLQHLKKCCLLHIRYKQSFVRTTSVHFFLPRSGLPQGPADSSHLHGSADQDPAAGNRVRHAGRDSSGWSLWEACRASHHDGRPGRAAHRHGTG